MINTNVKGVELHSSVSDNPTEMVVCLGFCKVPIQLLAPPFAGLLCLIALLCIDLTGHSEVYSLSRLHFWTERSSELYCRKLWATFGSPAIMSSVISKTYFCLPCRLSQIGQRLGRKQMGGLSWDSLQNISQHHQRHPVRSTFFTQRHILKTSPFTECQRGVFSTSLFVCETCTCKISTYIFVSTKWTVGAYVRDHCTSHYVTCANTHSKFGRRAQLCSCNSFVGRQFQRVKAACKKEAALLKVYLTVIWKICQRRSNNITKVLREDLEPGGMNSGNY